MEFIVKSRSAKAKAFVEHIMPEFIKQLGLEKSRKYVLVEISKDGPGKDNQGVTVPLPGLDTYVVAIKPGSLEVMGITLAHEMVHVKQMAKGILKSVKGQNYWNGKKYTNKTKYLYSPWEVEAFSKQELLFRRAIDIDTKKKRS